MLLNGENLAQTATQAQQIDAASNRLLGFTQTLTTFQNGKTRSFVTTPVTFSVDANGAITSDGLRQFEVDASQRLARVRVIRLSPRPAIPVT